MKSLKIRQFVVHIIISFMLGNILLSNAFARSIDSSANSEILICTSQGFKWLSKADELPQTQESRVKHCLLCVLNNIDSHNVALLGNLQWDAFESLTNCLSQVSDSPSLNLVSLLKLPSRAPPIS